MQGKTESMYLCLRKSVLFPPLMFPTLCGAVPSSVRDGYVSIVDGTYVSNVVGPAKALVA